MVVDLWPAIPWIVTAVTIRSLRSWPELKVVLMSGYFDDHSLLDAADERGWLFLNKPFDMAHLATRLRAALEQTAPTDDAPISRLVA